MKARSLVDGKTQSAKLSERGDCYTPALLELEDGTLVGSFDTGWIVYEVSKQEYAALRSGGFGAMVLGSNEAELLGLTRIVEAKA